MPSTLLEKPSYHQGFARNASESARPQDWHGLVGLWVATLGPSGLTLRDWSGYLNHGTLTTMDPATDWIIDGERGYVLAMDGTSDYIDVTGWIKITGSAPRTIIAMVKTPADATSLDTIISYGANATGERYTFRLHGSGSGTIGALRTEVDGSRTIGSIDLTDQLWHYVASSLEGTDVGDVVHYVDGLVDVASQTGSQAINTGSTVSLNIGREAVSSTGQWWDGDFAWLRIYDRVLTAKHHWDIYQDPTGIVRLAPRRQFHSIQAAAGGLSIPVAMHEYRQRHQSVV